MRPSLLLVAVCHPIVSLAMDARSRIQPRASGLTAAAEAVAAMMTLYDNSTGLWDPSAPWWQSALALQAVTDYMIESRSLDYISEAYNTVQIQSAPQSSWPQGGGNFRADSTDDTAWWAMALTSLYVLTGNRNFLDIAMQDEAYIANYWNATSCGGGLIWSIRTQSYRAAISNELYLALTATLHNLIPGDTVYLSKSLAVWDWFKKSGLINAQHLINDGLSESGNGTCYNNGAPTWTYNQGVILGGLLQLYAATRDSTYLVEAQTIANAVLADSTLAPNGILTEPCSPSTGCDPDQTAFKGIFVRNLAFLNNMVPGKPYSAFIQTNTASAFTYSKNGRGLYGVKWQGPFDTATIGRQVSAVNLMVAFMQT